MDRLLIRGGLLIDGTGKPPIQKGRILIEGDRIVSAGTEGDISPISGLEGLDLGDAVLLPGLIDCHNHLSMELTQEDWLARVNDRDAERTISASINMAVDLRAGVTTARCLGDKNFLDTACKKATESGRLAGPRLLVAGRSIRASHGHGILAYPFDGSEEVRRAVRENIKAGADVIKILTTGILPGPGEIHSDYSRKEISIAIEEAHRAGLRATAHCIGGIALEWLLDAGVDSIEHGYFLTDREIDLLAESGCWLILTPSPFFLEDRIRVFPSGALFRNKREEATERMAAAIKGGVKFAVGSDAIHGRLAKEIEYLVEIGASESQALTAATRDGAAACGIEGLVGTLEPGKAADLIAVKGDPLNDIEALSRISAVISRGKLFYVEPRNKVECIG